MDSILGDGEVTSLKIKNVKTGAISDLAVTGLFVAIGHKPNSELFAKYVDTDANGYVVTTGGTKQKCRAFSRVEIYRIIFIVKRLRGRHRLYGGA